MDCQQSNEPWVAAKIVKVMIYKDFIASEFFSEFFSFLFCIFAAVHLASLKSFAADETIKLFTLNLIDNAWQNADRSALQAEIDFYEIERYIFFLK